MCRELVTLHVEIQNNTDHLCFKFHMTLFHTHTGSMPITPVRQPYRSGMPDRHLVATLADNIFVNISKTMNFYLKCHRILFACHKILYKICSLQYCGTMHLN